MATTTWSDEVLAAIGAADEVQISVERADGSSTDPTPVWVVRVGDGLYVRSWRGGDGGWYRRALATRSGAVRVGGADHAVALGDVDPGLRTAIDRAYRAKYGRYGDAYVGPMTGDAAAAATLRLEPR
ncbi:DUF2255 family protein [Actinotalea sp. M2MS4P-6]|uniref:DUF2255 family protein n=1 Tax=Actinotalea sp. M2MS4P-6 TaxID=2983762 RepID=UPI0021E3D8E9|nr:DUF2255 family protein [Actinotalea sp. M2MS4P-6]MCV2395399.1 DUF2255 family protein [Actinotalea sp. M2MS4P-6]